MKFGLTSLKHFFVDRQNLVYLGVTFLFWLLLYLSDFPKPGIDDLVFTGSAINLAKGGDFYNPLLSVWSIQTSDRFFVQFPFHSRILSLWLFAFGVSTNSLLLFQFACYFGFSVFTSLLLRKYKFSWLSIYSIPIIHAIFMAKVGLRLEALAITYLVIGLWGLTYDSVPRYLLGFTFLGFSVTTYPVYLSYAVPFCLVILILNARSRVRLDTAYLRSRLSCLLSAIFLSILVFLWMINFEVQRFFSDLLWHASWRVPPQEKLWSEIAFIVFNGYNEIIYGSLYITLAFSVLLLFVRARKKNQKLHIFALALISGLIINLIIYVTSLTTVLNCFCWFGIAIILFNRVEFSRVFRNVQYVFCLLVLCIYQSQSIVAWLGQTPVSPEDYQEIIDWVAMHPERDYVIDSVAARYIFDYDLPIGSTDWVYQRVGLVGPESLVKKPPNEVWIISPAIAHHTEGLPDYERVDLFGRRFASIPRSPYRLIVVE